MLLQGSPEAAMLTKMTCPPLLGWKVEPFEMGSVGLQIYLQDLQKLWCTTSVSNYSSWCYKFNHHFVNIWVDGTTTLGVPEPWATKSARWAPSEGSTTWHSWSLAPTKGPSGVSQKVSQEKAIRHDRLLRFKDVSIAGLCRIATQRPIIVPRTSHQPTIVFKVSFAVIQLCVLEPVYSPEFGLNSMRTPWRITRPPRIHQTWYQNPRNHPIHPPANPPKSTWTCSIIPHPMNPYIFSYGH